VGEKLENDPQIVIINERLTCVVFFRNWRHFLVFLFLIHLKQWRVRSAVFAKCLRLYGDRINRLRTESTEGAV
jgi:hypothetical protein